MSSLSQEHGAKRDKRQLGATRGPITFALGALAEPSLPQHPNSPQELSLSEEVCLNVCLSGFLASRVFVSSPVCSTSLSSGALAETFFPLHPITPKSFHSRSSVAMSDLSVSLASTMCSSFPVCLNIILFLVMHALKRFDITIHNVHGMETAPRTATCCHYPV